MVYKGDVLSRIVFGLTPPTHPQQSQVSHGLCLDLVPLINAVCHLFLSKRKALVVGCFCTTPTNGLMFTSEFFLRDSF